MVLGLSFGDDWQFMHVQMLGVLNVNFWIMDTGFVCYVYIWLSEIVLISFYENDRISNKPRLNEVELKHNCHLIIICKNVVFSHKKLPRDYLDDTSRLCRVVGVFNENHTKHVNIILCGKIAVFLNVPVTDTWSALQLCHG